MTKIYTEKAEMWEVMQNLKPGDHVLAQKTKDHWSRFVKLQDIPARHFENVFAEISTGQVLHFSNIAAHKIIVLPSQFGLHTP